MERLRPGRLRSGHLRPTPSLPFSPPQLAPMGKVEGRELSKTYSDVFLEMGMNVFGSTSVMYNPVDGLIEGRVSDPDISQTRRECRGKTSRPTTDLSTTSPRKGAKKFRYIPSWHRSRCKDPWLEKIR